MAEIKQVNVGGTLYDIRDANAIPQVTYGEKTTLVNTTTVSFSKDGDNNWYISAENPISGFTSANFQENKIYIVTWDGVEYQTLVRYAENSTVGSYYEWSYFGNASIMGWRNAIINDNSLPFCVEYDFYRNAGEVQIFTTSAASTHTIKIEVIPFNIIKIDPTFYTDTYHQVPLIRTGSGQGSVILGMGAKDAAGEESFASGAHTLASGSCAHTEGEGAIASGNYSHAEGYKTTASESSAHAEGQQTTASGMTAHVEGYLTTASGPAAHAEGRQTTASGYAAHAGGYSTTASETVAYAEGIMATASGYAAHAQGYGTIANHQAQHVFGKYNIADPSNAAATAQGTYIEIVGNGTADNARSNARTLDWSGNEVLAGKLTVGAGPTNSMDVATKDYVDSVLPDTSSFMQKGVDYVTAGNLEGSSLGSHATAEGKDVIATGTGAHAEGSGSQATGLYSHAEGRTAISDGEYSHAEGRITHSTGKYSHVEGYYTRATHQAQHVFGRHNVVDPSSQPADEWGTYVEIVGNGADESNQSNARTLDWSGNEVLAGKLTVGANPTNSMDVATKGYVTGLFSLSGTTLTITTQ